MAAPAAESSAVRRAPMPTAVIQPKNAAPQLIPPNLSRRRSVADASWRRVLPTVLSRPSPSRSVLRGRVPRSSTVAICLNLHVVPVSPDCHLGYPPQVLGKQEPHLGGPG